MDKNFSVDDILKELEGKKSVGSVDDFDNIVDEILGKKTEINSDIKLSDINEIKKSPIQNEIKNSEDETRLNSFKDFAPLKNEQKKQEPIKEIKLEAKEQVKKEPPIKEIKLEEPKKEESKPLNKSFKVNIDYSDFEKPSAEPQINSDSEALIEEKTIQMNAIGSLIAEEEHMSSQLNNPVINEDLAEFKKSRKEKVDKFVIFGDEEEDNDPETEDEEIEEVGPIEDFNDYSETQAVVSDLSNVKASLTLRLIILSIITAISAYMELAGFVNIPVLSMLDKNSEPISYLIVSALVFAAAIIVSAPAIFGGIGAIFKKKSDADSLLSVATIGSVIQYVALFSAPSYIISAKNSVSIYSFVVILNMLLNTIGKLLIVRRTRQNFRFVSGGYDKCAIVYSENEKINQLVKDQFNSTYASLAVNKRTEFLGSFLNYSYREDPADKIGKVLSIVLLIGSALISVGCFIFNGRDIRAAVCCFAAVTAVCSPISAVLSVNLPLFRTVKKTSSSGCMISSIDACNEVYDVNSILVTSSSLFPKGSISLSAIKTFAAGKIDDAIIDAASVVITAESDLSDIFLSLIGGRRDMLREVDSIVYEESMGLSAWVDSKRVLIGNRELINNHGISTPSRDYEDRYLNDGMDIVYLAVSGELAAAFLIKYNTSAQIKKAMNGMEKLGIGIVVSTTDPNINAQKMADIFDVDSLMIKTVPAAIQNEAAKLMSTSKREECGIASLRSFTAFAQTLFAAIKLKGAASLAVSLMTVGVILGFALSVFFAVMSANVNISVGAVTLYQLFWLLAVIVLPAIRKIRF